MNKKTKEDVLVCPNCKMVITDRATLRCPRCNVIVVATTCQGNCRKCQSQSKDCR